MPQDIRFDSQVVVVTGAGNGLGRAHALLLGRRGAKVVVNDYGPDLSGSGQSTMPADVVVAQIREAGGEAVANYDSVHTRAGGEAIVRTAIDAWGRIDAVVCNAGILKNEPFGEQSEENWRRHLAVHLDGTMYTTLAAWRYMQQAGYGRVVVTSSGGGMYGVAGLTAYGAAKAGVFGLMRCLAQEVAGSDIRVNCVLPAAMTRMLGTTSREKMRASEEQGDPALVSPLVAYLASTACRVNGKAYSAGAGFFAVEQMVQGTGFRFDHREVIEPEQIAARWDEINDTSTSVTFSEARENGARIFGVT